MKKFFSMIAVFAAMFAFASCTPDEGTDKPGPNPGPTGGKLATPVLTETHTETGFTVAWEAVTNADSYMVNLDGKNYTTAECSYTFENLKAGEYTVRVKAKGAGYEDSDNAKIVISLTGLTSVDWFTQQLFVLDEPYQFEDGSVAYPYNSLFFEWKGTGVADIQYGLFETSKIEGAKDGDIKAALQGLGSQLSYVLEYVNGEGFQSLFEGLSGSTSYTLCALVTNTEGVECLVKTEATTAEAVLSDAAKAWTGSYSAQATQLVTIDEETTVFDQVTNFNFTVAPIEGTADQVLVDGLSIFGEGTPAMGQVATDAEGNYLMAVFNFVSLGEISADTYMVWYAFCDIPAYGDYYFVSGDYPAITFTMTKDGAISCENYAGKLQDGSDYTVCAFDVAAVDGQGKLKGLFTGQDGSVYNTWKFGVYTNIAKTEAAASALSAKPAIAGVVPTSVVVAM